MQDFNCITFFLEVDTTVSNTQVYMHMLTNVIFTFVPTT